MLPKIPVTVEEADQVQDPFPATAVGLWAAMSAVSEEIWCAGWLMGLEEVLWAVLKNEDGPLSEYERQQIKDCEEWNEVVRVKGLVGGWCCFEGWVDDETWARELGRRRE